MASVQRYACEAEIFPIYIIHKHAALEDIEKERHFSALKIQRYYRGFLVRKMVAGWHHAATTIQKHIRGFLLRWHLPEILQEYVDWYRLQYYNRMAATIQARWRGYLVRRDNVPIKELLRRRKVIEEANGGVRQVMKEAFDSMEQDKLNQMENEAQEWVLYILFKIHHLTRTQAQEGIYSMHGETKLSTVEELLKALPLTDYMHELKEGYYRLLKQKKTRATYIYKSERLRKIEEEYYSGKDRNLAVRDNTVVVPRLSIHDKRFILDNSKPKKPYQRLTLCTEDYSGKRFSFSKPLDKTKNVCDKDFDLHVLKKVNIPQKPPPYYLDFWEPECRIHNVADM